eukprot:scaffold215623_cov17-Tisochrysis_lutea.AAC.1
MQVGCYGCNRNDEIVWKGGWCPHLSTMPVHLLRLRLSPLLIIQAYVRAFDVLTNSMMQSHYFYKTRKEARKFKFLEAVASLALEVNYWQACHRQF